MLVACLGGRYLVDQGKLALRCASSDEEQLVKQHRCVCVRVGSIESERAPERTNEIV